MNRVIGGLAALVLAALPLLAEAQAWPSRRITVLCPFPPGAITDLLARMYASHLEKKYKQPVIVENRPGAGMNVAADATVKAPADGYTLLAASDALHWESLLNKDTPFNSQKDILPYGIFAASGLFLGVNANVPVKTAAEFVAYARANPGKINVGLAGTPTLGFEEMRSRQGIEWVNVTYRGGAPAFQALLANEVQLYSPDIMQGLPQHQAGKIRLLAYTASSRHPAAPDIPTFVEAIPNMQGFEYKVWLGMFARPEVPADIIGRLNADVIEMQNTPEAIQRFAAMGWSSIPFGVEAVRRDVENGARKVQRLLDQGVKLR